ncbi:isonitrile hydratase [Oxobacter pfennigii]|uniref:Isonitrile hydratase n=1 Tax=Oxobacter pfennigii TaxID=36849 RepID=A0A0P8YSU5_9CLOT|nr:DJ-1/PfpI family protein [Oxobacter pfennigii]KPU42753.1 isonitrile hydratase [Oxobacter pfennigii]
MRNVGIFLFDDMELLDFAGPYEVFSVANELKGYALLNVFTITHDGKQVRTINGLKVVPDYNFENHPPIDILVIPGGNGSRALLEKPHVLDWIKKAYECSLLTMSVCSGARLLGKIGLLDDIQSTTHHEVFEDLRSIAPKAIIIENARFIDNGRIMTSGGISAGIDLSLHVVEKLFGREISNKTKVYMEYGEWK